MSNKTQKQIAKDVEEDEAPQTSKPKGKGYKGKKPSEKKGKRDDKRMENFRSTTSEKTVQENKEALFEKLFFGYKNINEAMKNIQLQQVERTIIIPISTRASGFIIRSMISKFIQLGLMLPDEAKLLAGALYRVTLLQIDYKLEEAMIIQHSRNLDTQSYDDAYINSDYRRSLELMGGNFSPLVNYISAIGFVKTAAKNYLPRHPKLVSSYAPAYQRFNILRETVEGLSRDALDVTVKRAFMESCPFPNATWSINRARRDHAGEELPASVNLANPNDIIVADYGVAQLRQDIFLIATYVEKIGRKYPKYVATGGIDWKGTGSISVLVSNEMATICCPSWPIHGGPVRSIEGDYDNFWIPEIISDPEAYMGVVYMLGEIKIDHLSVPDSASFRRKASACREISLEYATVMQNLLN